MVQTARPDADDGTDGNWTDQGGGTSLYAAIDEASADNATTFIQSTDSGSNDICIVQLADISTPGSGNVYIKYTAQSDDNSGMGAPGIKLELLEGASVEGTITNNSVASSWTAYSSAALDVSGVSSFSGLKLRITMLANSGSGMDVLKLTQAYLETPDAGGGGSAIIPIAMNTYRQMRG